MAFFYYDTKISIIHSTFRFLLLTATFIHKGVGIYDQTLYNEKFAKPATAIMKIINKKGIKENKANFANDIDWIYWELWHHEGRRARHGAAMMGPDYAWWHGIYDVIHNFYFEFIPAAKDFNDPDVNAALDKLLKEDPMHQWFLTKTSAELKKAINSGELQKVYSNLFNEK